MAIDYMIDAVTVIFIRVRGRIQRVSIYAFAIGPRHSRYGDIWHNDISRKYPRRKRLEIKLMAIVMWFGLRILHFPNKIVPVTTTNGTDTWYNEIYG